MIVVVGPTAIGKTALGVELAKAFQTDVINADSRQFYCDMSIGTAKPTPEEMDEVPHHFIDFLPLDTPYSAGEFERQALAKTETLFKEKDVLVMVGGSGLYINSVCHGLDETPPKDNRLRKYLTDQYEKEGIGFLQNKLKVLDPEFYKQIDPENPQRLIRALEVNMLSGKSYTAFRTSIRKHRPFSIIKTGINKSRSMVYDRINKRVDAMMEKGLLDEALHLYPFRAYNALNTVGYKELFEYFDGNATLEEAVEHIKRNTRRFSKRQLTWFRRDEEIKWFRAGDNASVLHHINAQIHA